MIKVHNLKLNIEFCDAVYQGIKTFEIRKNDRGFQTGDFIIFVATNGFYSRDPITLVEKEKATHPINNKLYEITYVLNGWGLKNGYVALGIKERRRDNNGDKESN